MLLLHVMSHGKPVRRASRPPAKTMLPSSPANLSAKGEDAEMVLVCPIGNGHVLNLYAWVAQGTSRNWNWNLRGLRLPEGL